MPSPRISGEELTKILTRKGYGISGSIGKGEIDTKIGDSRSINDVEPNPSDEPLGSEGLQIRSAGKICVSVKFYRYRLADYSRAISEKAIVDCLQYAGLICGDSEKEIRLEDKGQEKVDSKAEERTEITIEYPELDLDNLWEPRKRTDGR